MRQGTRDWLDAKAEVANSGFRSRRGSFRGTNFVPEAQQQQERVADREFKKQALMNKGNLDVQERSELGQTKRTGMREAGSMARAGMQEAGSTARAGMQKDTSMRRLGFDQEREQTRFMENTRDFGLKKKKLALDKMFKDRKFTADQKKSYLERLDKLTTPKLDTDGFEIEGSAMTYGGALDQMDFEERALKERAGRR